jgi:hypothetical protein
MDKSRRFNKDTLCLATSSLDTNFFFFSTDKSGGYNWCRRERQPRNTIDRSQHTTDYPMEAASLSKPSFRGLYPFWQKALIYLSSLLPFAF